MGHTIERADISMLLDAVERSVFNRFVLHADGLRVCATRFGGMETTADIESADTCEAVLAPRVGIFHLETSAGSQLKTDAVIGRIETFGATTSVKAGRAGQLAAVLVPDGQFVEYGQPVARIQIASQTSGS